MKYIIVEHLFMTNSTVIKEDMKLEEAEELCEKMNEENEDKLYREYVVCPEDPTP